MAVEIRFSVDELMQLAEVGSIEELEALAIEPGGEEESEAGDGITAWEYMQGDSASGICGICAPFVGMIFEGEDFPFPVDDGDDGYPKPDQHPNCVCWLQPVGIEELDRAGGNVNFEWMENLSSAELRRIVGPGRASMVEAGDLRIGDLYDAKTMRLKPLSKTA